MADAPTLCWFPWFPKDWLTSDKVGRMTDAQYVAYFQLLNRQWLCAEGMLPDDLDVLTKYAGHDMKANDMAAVLAQFPVVKDGCRANKRLYIIYLQQNEKHQKRVFAGKRGSNARSNASSNATPNAGSTMASGSGSEYESEYSNPMGGAGGWTLDHVIETGAKPTVAVPKDVAQAYFDHRARRDWLDGAGHKSATTQEGLESDMRHFHRTTWPNMKNAGPGGRGKGSYYQEREVPFSKIPMDEAEREAWRKQGWLDERGILKNEFREQAKEMRGPQ